MSCWLLSSFGIRKRSTIWTMINTSLTDARLLRDRTDDYLREAVARFAEIYTNMHRCGTVVDSVCKCVSVSRLHTKNSTEFCTIFVHTMNTLWPHDELSLERLDLCYINLTRFNKIAIQGAHQISVALFTIYFFSHVACARPSAFGRGWWLAY